ncbi:putative DNA-binding protein [Janibacter sp. HTCC2649]|uniref:helix-turn-helix domain-containing protein n=1 Tax=Janibacter sp. HTCC2649 TaxID=313589 RepID=UPI000067101B|nr:helix-turn-helix domain-containing protein [Janibacter sp. HTCC2649]EAP97459.1 putative DNA-binding protein [Janibacter sp. HTCC2649]
MTSTEALEQQRALYGAPLADLGATVRGSLGLTQGRLAEALGLSAPMLSQLMSGQRVKIGNPAVVHRLQRLLDLAREGHGLSPDEIETRISAIREEQSTLTGAATDDAQTVRALATSASVEQLLATATAAEAAGAAVLADQLRRAAGVARG